MSFWNSLQQSVSDLGSSIASINVGDSARKLVGRAEEQGDPEDDNKDLLEKSHSTNPPRPGCPLVVPEPSKNSANAQGPEAAQNSFFFPRLYGTPTFLKRVSSEKTSPQNTSLDDDTSSSYRTGSIKANAQRFFGTRGLKNSGDAGSIDSSNISTERFNTGNGRTSTGATEDIPGKRKSHALSGKRSSNNSTAISRPSCFTEMPQRWAEVTDTRSG